MSDFEKWSLLLSALVTLIALATAVFYFRQLKVMSEQLLAAQHAAKAQSALMLVQHLQAPDVRKARHTVRSRLANLKLDDWTDEDRSDAALVVANYDVAAALIKSDAAPMTLIADNWGPSITHCHAVLAPFVADLRSRPGGCADYWSNFDWLANYVSRRCQGLL